MNRPPAHRTALDWGIAAATLSNAILLAIDMFGDDVGWAPYLPFSASALRAFLPMLTAVGLWAAAVALGTLSLRLSRGEGEQYSIRVAVLAVLLTPFGFVIASIV